MFLISTGLLLITSSVKIAHIKFSMNIFRGVGEVQNLKFTVKSLVTGARGVN